PLHVAPPSLLYGHRTQCLQLTELARDPVLGIRIKVAIEHTRDGMGVRRGGFDEKDVGGRRARLGDEETEWRLNSAKGVLHFSCGYLLAAKVCHGVESPLKLEHGEMTPMTNAANCVQNAIPRKASGRRDQW